MLVVGSPGCGKSTLIAKGLMPWSLEREKPIILGHYREAVQLSSPPVNTTMMTASHEVRGVSRIAHVSVKSKTFAVEMVEVSSRELLRCGGEWARVIATGSNLTGAGMSSKRQEREDIMMGGATGR